MSNRYSVVSGRVDVCLEFTESMVERHSQWLVVYTHEPLLCLQFPFCNCYTLQSLPYIVDEVSSEAIQSRWLCYEIDTLHSWVFEALGPELVLFALL